MTPQKYIIYTEGAKPQSELRQVYEAFEKFISVKECKAMILPNTYRIDLLPERPQPGRAKRKNRNV